MRDLVGVIGLVGGLVLWLAAPHAFAGAKTVGIILTVVFGLPLAVVMLIVILGVLAAMLGLGTRR